MGCTKQRRRMTLDSAHKINMIKTYKSPKTSLCDDEVFVFGANSQGFHAGGAAGFATSGDLKFDWRRHCYDSKPNGWKGKWTEKGKLGPQIGTEGKSYAIPTVTRAGAKRSIPLSEIKKSIEKFYNFAKSRPHLKFFVAQGLSGNLNGYSSEELATIYSGDIPENVYFDEGFAGLLNKSGGEANFFTKIVHCKRGKFTEYIGRPKAGGEWRYGNPFVIGRDGDRPTVIKKMNDWLETGESFGNIDATPERRQWILDHVHELKDETLGCWCDYPKEDCHGRILKELAEINPEKPIVRCIVAGSRSIEDYQLVCAAIKESGLTISEIVSGTAEGVDKMGERFAAENNLPVKKFPAEWDNLSHPDAIIKTNSSGKKYDARAGFRRNQDMSDYADALIAITTGSSGTADMIERAKKKGLTIFVKEVS